MDGVKPVRRSPRAPAFDYTTPGAYFVTAVCQDRRPLFGAVGADATMHLSEAGSMIKRWWQEIPNKFKRVELDAFVVMPNHVHGLLWLSEQPRNLSRISLPGVLGWFKTMTTNEYIRGVRQLGWTPFDRKLWQRSFYEHVVRKNEDLNAIRRYIEDNPLRWSEDHENPELSR